MPLADFMKENSKRISFVAKIDSKGRIVLPADVRKTLGLAVNDTVTLDVSVSGNYIVIRRMNYESL